MRRVCSGSKYFAAIAAVMSFMFFAVPILAQQDEMMAGRMAGSAGG
jgi:hypothetical protein